MVGGTTHQAQQAPQLAPPSLSTAPATTPEEEELLKRNTDCVYFLASPLTCKKGSECEYRHSDIARVNPRDCWYWLNGNCLNPKCGFRHPPLDGLLGVDALTPMGPSIPQLHTPVTPAVHATPYAMPKQGVACIFFQKGFCLKGHLCPFLHGPPNPGNNKSAQSGPVNPVAEPPKMAYSGPEKAIQEQKFTQQATIQKPVEFLLPRGKQAPRMQAPPPARNDGGGAIDRKVQPPTSMGVKEPPHQKSPPVMNEMLSSKRNCGVYQANHVSDNNRILNGKDADEYSREPSPGFDVLVDNELGDSDYYHNEDEFGRSRGHSFDVGHSAEYDVARDMHHERQDYDHYSGRDRLQEGQYVWEDRRISPERKLVGSAHLERKTYPRSASPNHFDESDLRYRISKQRRGSDIGLRSVVSHDYHRCPVDQGVLSGRLRGRIKIPGRSMSPTNENDSRVERATDLGQKPGRPPHTSFYQSRLRDYKGSHGCRDIISDLNTKFTGPKRLSELKSGRTMEGNEHQMNDRQSLGKRKHPKVERQPSADNLSFEGPKPLSEILKRKRGTETRAVDNQKEREIIIAGSTGCTNKEDGNSVSAIFEQAEKQTVTNDTERDKSVDEKSSLNHDASEQGIEEGLIDEDAMLDQELEAYDHRDGDYDYEQIDGEDYNLEEGENPDEDYVDEDEYAKKESIVYS